MNQEKMRQCSRKVAIGRRVVGVIRSLVDARSLQLECAKVLHESLLAPVLTYSSETMVWREKETSRIWAIQMDNLRGPECRDNAVVWSGERCGRKD